MISHSSPNLQTIRTAAYAATLLLAATAPAHADMGVPMLAVVWPLSWLLLIPVIAIEAVVAYRLLGNDWRKSFKISAIANLVSTLVGIPLVWVIWLLIEIAVSSMFPKSVTYPANPPMTVISGDWIFPGYPEALWPVAGATCFMLIPMYYASVWIEGAVARKRVQEAERAHATRRAWRANLWSYALLEIAAVGWLV